MSAHFQQPAYMGMPPGAPPVLAMSNESERTLRHHKRLVRGMRGAAHAKKYTDMKIVCNGREWHCHHLTICAQSTFFEKAIDHNLREKRQESLDLSADDASAIEAMIDFMYSGQYDYNDSDDAIPVAGVLHVRVYVLADKYFVRDLKASALEQLEHFLVKNWSNAEFCEVVKEVYRDEANPARDIVVKTIVKLHHELYSDSIQYDLFRDTAADIPILAEDVLCMMTKPSTMQIDKYEFRRYPDDEAEEDEHAAKHYVCPRCRLEFDAYMSPDCEYTHSCQNQYMVTMDRRLPNSMTAAAWAGFGAPAVDPRMMLKTYDSYSGTMQNYPGRL